MTPPPADPPEAVFYRYFIREYFPDDLKPYSGGRLNLAELPDWLHELLEHMQTALNTSFTQSHEALAASGRQLFVHVDYIKSDTPNAIAFEHGGYNFIAITTALIDKLLKRSEELSQSLEVARILDIQRNEAFAGPFLLIQIVFVCAHEFGHHLGGHTIQSGQMIINEILNDTKMGSLTRQARESFADGYAVYLVLHFLIESPQQRDAILERFGKQHMQVEENDKFLLKLLLISAAAYFFTRLQSTLNRTDIYLLTHPPAMSRINGIFQTARVWCQRERPSLNEWLTTERLNDIMRAAEHARTGETGGDDLATQIAFLSSPDGREYHVKLAEAFAAMQPPDILRPPSA